MPSNAPVCRVADLMSRGQLLIGDGYRAKNEELTSNGLPFARAGNVSGGFHFEGADHVPADLVRRLGSKVSQPGDVVFTSKGTVGRFAFVHQDTPTFVYSPQLCFWRSLDEDVVDPRFLYYWMQGREFYRQFKGVAGQTDMAEYVSLADQRAMSISLPPIAQQRAVANILGSLDDKIEINRRVNETLEAIGRAIFKSWFIDFDPVHAKANGRTTNLPIHLESIFPNAFEDSELGEIPQGWSVLPIDSCCTRIFSGGTPSTRVPTYWDGGVPWLSSGETRNKFVVTTTQTITPLGAEQSSTRLARTGSTVIASAGQGHTRGQTALLMLDTFINQSVVVLEADEVTCSDLFLFFDLERRYQQFRQISDSSSSRGSLTTKMLAGLPTVLPPRPLIVEFERIASSLTTRIGSGLRQSEVLGSLRSALLPRLLSGEIRPVGLGQGE